MRTNFKNFEELQELFDEMREDDNIPEKKEGEDVIEFALRVAVKLLDECDGVLYRQYDELMTVSYMAKVSASLVETLSRELKNVIHDGMDSVAPTQRLGEESRVVRDKDSGESRRRLYL